MKLINNPLARTAAAVTTLGTLGCAPSQDENSRQVVTNKPKITGEDFASPEGRKMADNLKEFRKLRDRQEKLNDQTISEGLSDERQVLVEEGFTGKSADEAIDRLKQLPRKIQLKYFNLVNTAKPGSAQEKFELAIEDLEATEAQPNAMPEIIEFKQTLADKWSKKREALELYGKDKLPEIHFQTHVRIEVQKETDYVLFAKIQSELEEAFYEMRNDVALDVFGESYGAIKKRFDNDEIEDKNGDGPKIEMLEILFPQNFIFVTPK